MRTRLALLFAAGLLLQAQGAPSPPGAAISARIVPPPPITAPDGRVRGLNSAAFARLVEIRKGQPGAINAASAAAIRDAVKADGKLDSVERDLIDELLQPVIRSITVTEAGTVRPPRDVVLFPVSGPSLRLLVEFVDPPFDYASAWTRGAAGWGEIVRDFARGGQHERAAQDFVAARLGESWKLSNLGNAYKPLRDRFGQLYSWSAALHGDQVAPGRWILFNAMAQLDREQADNVPDFLYTWVKPQG